MNMKIHSNIKDRILEAQIEASKNVNSQTKMLRSLDKQSERKDDVRLYFVERIWVPVYGNLRTLIMNEAHTTKYFVHPREVQMLLMFYVTVYWWGHGMEEGYRFKWENITMDFITRLTRTSSGYDSIWVIVNRLTKSAHFLAIREDYKTEKLSRVYIIEIVARHGPFEVVERVGPVAFRLRLPQELVGIHDTFHVSNLKKCLADVNLHVPLEEIKIDDKLRFVEEPIEIIDREVKKLKQSWISIVKVHWNS
ncbi:putative reverse transcriptase domain-containing protein [Tanacetum coccineum]